MTRSISATEALVCCRTSRRRIRNPRLDASTLSRFTVVVSLRVERGVSRDVSPAESDCASAVYIFAKFFVISVEGAVFECGESVPVAVRDAACACFVS